MQAGMTWTKWYYFLFIDDFDISLDGFRARNAEVLTQIDADLLKLF
jgi:hypothetical protein